MALKIRHNCRRLLWVSAALLLPARVWAAATCANAPHQDHPHVTISNGDVTALIFLPDAKNGYYRSSRFDWSGVVACAAYKGHTFWGEWFAHYDPLGNDSITGPVEEFRSAEGAVGYDAAPVGGLFVKVGVGVLRRDEAGAYQFGHVYPIVDSGQWTVQTGARSVTFHQLLRSPTGVAYEYTKVLSLGEHGPTLTLQHELKNLAESALVTDVYDHDFFMMDAQPVGTGNEVRFPFTPVAQQALLPGAEITGKTVVYKQAIPKGGTVASYLTGYGTTPSDYEFRIADNAHHLGIEQRGDRALVKLYLWSIPSTICPEAYIHLQVAPDQTERWRIEYTLSAEEDAR